jgi:adenine-specific DNA-methyltransferase
LLPLIREALDQTDVVRGTFVDFFAGSGVVARFAKSQGFRVVANDWEPYAGEINRAYIGCNRPPSFTGLGLGGPDAVFSWLNGLPPREGYVAHHLCPRDDENVDSNVERQFFTRANGQRIDAIREEVGAWERRGLLSPDERAYVLAALLYATSYVSNTSGVFKGFHRGWGGATGTALYRILSELRLVQPITWDNGEVNQVTTLDAQLLAERLGDYVDACDVAYLDPPYNQHPYGANYHVLNTVALWDKPAVEQTIIGGNKSAIRTDWRTERRSAYNSRVTAPAALRNLLRSIRSRWILISYSTDGLIPLQSLVETACQRGTVSVVTGQYKRYRVSTQRYSRRAFTVELVLVVDALDRPRPDRAEGILEKIRQASDVATAGRWGAPASDLVASPAAEYSTEGGTA